MGMSAVLSITSLARKGKVSEDSLVPVVLCELFFCHTVVSISVVGEEVVDVTETDLMFIIQLEVTGYSFGIVPLQILPLSYSQFEDVREMFDIQTTLGEIAGSQVIPTEEALPCESLI